MRALTRARLRYHERDELIFRALRSAARDAAEGVLSNLYLSAAASRADRTFFRSSPEEFRKGAEKSGKKLVDLAALIGGDSKPECFLEDGMPPNFSPHLEEARQLVASLSAPKGAAATKPGGGKSEGTSHADH